MERVPLLSRDLIMELKRGQDPFLALLKDDLGVFTQGHRTQVVCVVAWTI